VCGKFLYYARAVDTTMLHTLNDLATQTTKRYRKNNGGSIIHFLNYCATHPDAELIVRASDMVFHNHSDRAYLVASEARSRAGGFTYMGNHKGKPQRINGAILVIGGFPLIATFLNSSRRCVINSILSVEFGYILLPVLVLTVCWRGIQPTEFSFFAAKVRAVSLFYLF
jgi:hypothetical protein